MQVFFLGVPSLGNVSPNHLHSLHTAGSSICESRDSKDPQEDVELCTVIIELQQVFV